MTEPIPAAKKFVWSVPLLALYFMMFLVVAGVGVIAPFLPFYAKRLGANGLQLGLMITVFSLTQVLAAPIWGRFSDRWGRKPILIAGMIGYGFSFFLMAWSKSVGTLLISRALGGLLSASAFPTAQAYLVDLTTSETRSYSLSYMAAASNVGFLLGPAFGSLFAQASIEAAFVIGGALILLTAVAGLFLLPAVHPGPAAPDKSSLRWETLAPNLLGRTSVYLWNTLLFSFGTSTMYSILGYYMIEKFNATTAQTALIYTVMGGVSAILQAVVVGRVLKWYGENVIILLSLLIGLIGFVGLIFSPDLLRLYVWVAVISASMALIRPSLLLAISRQSRIGQGLMMGLQGSFDSFGRVVGPTWAGWISGVALAGPYWSSAAIFIMAMALHLMTFGPIRDIVPLQTEQE